MAMKPQAKKAPLGLDRLSPDMQTLHAERQKARQAQLASEPETPHFPGTRTLEEQVYHAMRIITCVRLVLSGGRMEKEDREAAADLLWGAQHFLESLDPAQLALDKEQARAAVIRGGKAA